MFEGLAGIGGAIKGGSLHAARGRVRETAGRTIPIFRPSSETIPGFVSKGWLALMAPAGTPESIIAKVNADLKIVLAQHELLEQFAAIGTYPQPLSPADTAAFIRAEQQLWWPVVRQVEQKR